MKLKTKFRALKKIYHVSDIQIRNLQRHNEYEQVFENLYTFISKDTENAIIYIGGDIAHSKTDMSPELVDQLSRLFKNLSNLAPTLLIAGNHDCNLNNRSRLDVLQPIVENIKNENLHYLNETGVYYLADVAFAVLEVRDDVKSLPDPKTINAKTKILLHHGTVDKSVTDLGFYLPSALKLKNFNGYDMVLLGDIHKLQTMQEYKDGRIKKPIVRYCGSLVQQNHGETLEGHGVSVWDVKKRKFVHKEIKNEFGYYTLSIEDGLVPKVENMPEKARLRIKVKNTSSTDLKKALTIIKHRHNIKEVSIIREDSYRVDTGNSSIVDFGDVFDPDVQNGLIEQYLKNNTVADDETIEKVKKINKELSSSIIGEEISRNISWKPKKFEFSNMFSYGEDNVVNFERCNGIAGLFSPNASGKSSLLDALTFCLFDKSTRAYKAENVMNNSKSNFSCKLEFDVGNETYVIKRKGKILSNKVGSTRVDVDFYRIEDGKKISLNGDQRNSTNKNIRKLIGTYDDFIMTSFSAQNNSSVFLEQNQTEKKEILGKFLGLSIFDQLFKLAKEESSGLQSMLKNFLDVDYDQQISDIETELNQANEVIVKLEDSHNKKEDTRDKHKNKVLDLMKSIRPIDARVKDLQVLEGELESEERNKSGLVKRLDGTKLMSTEAHKNNEILINRIESEKYRDIDNRIIEYELIINQRDAAKKEIDSLKVEVRNKLDKINKLGDLQYDSDCSYCMNNVFVKDAIRTKEELKEDKTRASATLAKLKTVENKIQINEDVPKSYTEFLDLTGELKGTMIDIDSYDVRMGDINDNIKTSESLVVSMKNEIKRSKGFQKDIQYNNRLQVKIDENKSAESIMETEIKAVNQDVQQYIGKRSALETKKQEIIQVINRVKDLEGKFEAYRYYLMAVDKNGVSYDLISKVLVKVESEVNNILSQIVQFQIIFDMDGKDINNYIAYSDDRSWPLEMASGMEKFISGLAIRIALTNISNLPRPNFIAIDEGWGTMDSDNLNSLYQLFQYLKNIYQFSLIISHIDTMRDFTDILLEIKQENGHSKIIF
jgi:DNA repair exonuclease SbcCD ATPase subunit